MTVENKKLALVEKSEEQALNHTTNDLKRENINKLLQYYYFKRLKQGKFV